jgi:hypothetical protein
MTTVVGLMHLSFHLPQARSLKDKRRIVKSFKDRTRNRFNVAVAEVEGLEQCRRAVLAVAAVANSRQVCDSSLQKIADQAAMHRDMILLEQQTDWL